MVDTEPPNKRIRYDLTTTFDVIVGRTHGHEKRFPVYHDILTARSDFFLAALATKPQQPVRLNDEDPDVFSLYLNCVHSGMEIVRAGGEFLSRQSHTASDGVENLVKRERDSEQGADESEDDTDGGRFEALIRLHLLANKLQGFDMMDSVIDELVRMVDEDGLIPTHVNLIYTSTKRGDSLRTLVRDVYVHEAEISEHHEFLRTSDLHPEFWRDISLEYFRLKNGAKSIGEVCGLKIGRDKKVSKCNYHRRQTDDVVQIMPPQADSAAGATTVGMRDRAAMLPQASGRSSHDVAAAADDVAAQGHPLPAPQTSSQSGQPVNTSSLVATKGHAPVVPQGSVRKGNTAAAASEPTGRHASATPARRGRPSGTGTFVFRRPKTSNVWWSVSADRFEDASVDVRYKFTHVGRAQEEGTVRATPCDRCARKGYGDTCSSLPGERCGRCVWDKVGKGDGC